MFSESRKIIFASRQGSCSASEYSCPRPEPSGIDPRGIFVAKTPASNLSHVENRSEEHTSELQSRGHLVCRLLLEKKKGCAPWTRCRHSRPTRRPSPARIATHPHNVLR